MRWERLFANLEAQEAAESLRAREGNIAEMTRLLAGEALLQERLSRRVGQELAVWIAGRETVLRLTLTGVGKDWFSGTEAGRDVLVQSRHVFAIEPNQKQSEQRSEDTRRLTVGIRSALRELARQRTQVEVQMVGGQGSFCGTIDQVAMDHCVLAQHAADEFRRSKAVRSVVWLPQNHIAALYSWR